MFKEYVGISPKRLSRTLRLNYLMNAVRNLDSVDWHDLIVTFQISTSLAMLISAALLMQSVRSLASVDPGFRADDLPLV